MVLNVSWYIFIVLIFKLTIKFQAAQFMTVQGWFSSIYSYCGMPANRKLLAMILGLFERYPWSWTNHYPPRHFILNQLAKMLLVILLLYLVCIPSVKLRCQKNFSCFIDRMASDCNIFMQQAGTSADWIYVVPLNWPLKWLNMAKAVWPSIPNIFSNKSNTWFTWFRRCTWARLPQ